MRVATTSKRPRRPWNRRLPRCVVSSRSLISCGSTRGFYLGLLMRTTTYNPLLTSAVFLSHVVVPQRGHSWTISTDLSNVPREWHRRFSPFSSAKQQSSWIHSTSRLQLNRFLFDVFELESLPPRPAPVERGMQQQETDDDDKNNNSVFCREAVLPKDDYRTQHAAKILGLHNGDVIRAGVLSCDAFPHGLWTDTATIEWLPEGKVKKAEPLAKSGKPPGSLRIRLDHLQPPVLEMTTEDDTVKWDMPRVSLLLALPRPLQLGRILPMISQLGCHTLVLMGASKVPKDYFGSHLLRTPQALRDRLIEGLCQAGDVRMPPLHVVKHWRQLTKPRMVNKDNTPNDVSIDDKGAALSMLDELFPKDQYLRLIAHPERLVNTAIDDNSTTEMSPPVYATWEQLDFPNPQQPHIVLAVGPEGGWEEPDELQHWFRELDFQPITLGPRVLRTDCAVVSLMALAHEACRRHQSTQEQK